MLQAYSNLPEYLKAYVADQDYDAYTSQEHATWRYIMRQSRAFFRKHAVPIYVEGLAKTGIPIDRIPRIAEMNECLSKFGWGAVGVDGFIPSSIFLDLLAHKMLPIATSMRTVEHVAYTPAPDIVHEAAGHAPIIADPHYRKFLEEYAEIAYRAIITKEDIGLYEAIRYLSDIKENPDTPKKEIALAEERLKLAYKSMSYLSEASKVARLAWWTIEYGLVGDQKNPQIYGAGLLSSVGESKDCLSSKIKKIPLTLDCVDTGYDITEHQPQLFVAPSLDSLPEVLHQLADTFVYKKGGLAGLKEAKRAETVNTIILDSGLGISGQLVRYEMGKTGELVDFVKFQGPVQLTYMEEEISGQGRAQHPDGFSSPLGRLKELADKPTCNLSDDDLKQLGISQGQRAKINFQNGFMVEGRVQNWLRKNGKLLLMTLHDAKVVRGQDIFYQPNWGAFDMVFGETVESVFCGPADRDAYGDFDAGEASTSPKRSSAFTPEEKQIFNLFDQLRDLRRLGSKDKDFLSKLAALAAQVDKDHKDQWLLGLEILELGRQSLKDQDSGPSWLTKIEQNLMNQASQKGAPVQDLVQRGLEIHRIFD